MEQIFKYGKVVSIIDDKDGDRIKVHIRGIDPSNYNIKDLPYSFPLLPKHVGIKPKIGEMVMIFTQDGSLDNDRFYIGPIISQTHKLGFDSTTADSLLKGGYIEPDISPSTIPENRGLTPNPDDITIFGRGSTDIIQMSNELRIRAGKTLDSKTLNRESMSYVQMKHIPTINKTYTNIVANQINLLSHDSLTKFNLTDPDALITDEEYQKILEQAHQLPYGDILVQYFELFKKAFLTHVHPYHGLSPDATQIELKNYLEFEFKKLLSDNIRIN